MKQKNDGTLAHIDGTLAHIKSINNANNLKTSDNAKNREFTYVDMHLTVIYPVTNSKTRIR